jgi:hypothetical protein
MEEGMFKMKPRGLWSAAACLVAVAALCSPDAARADDHLPIIDIQPVTTFAGAGGIKDTPATGPIQNGNINIAGVVTIPVAKGLSLSYIRTINGVYNNTFAPVILPLATAVGGPGTTYPGNYNDVVENYQFDEHFKRFNLEGGFSTRHRMCCPASGDPNQLASTEWHQVFLGLTYSTPSISFLDHGLFVLNITGHSANHNPPPGALEFEQFVSPGVVDVGKREYGTTQAATFVLPLNHGFSTTGTYTWGAFDYFENYPYPLNYGIWVFTANKSFNKYFGLELREANLWQRPNQNTPFPGNAIHVVDWSIIADFHLNLNNFIK